MKLTAEQLEMIESALEVYIQEAEDVDDTFTPVDRERLEDVMDYLRATCDGGTEPTPCKPPMVVHYTCFRTEGEDNVYLPTDLGASKHFDEEVLGNEYNPEDKTTIYRCGGCGDTIGVEWIKDQGWVIYR